MIRRRENNDSEAILNIIDLNNGDSISMVNNIRTPFRNKVSNSSSALNADIKKHNNPNLITKKPWKKLLWVHQEYPDNYVDTSFLSQLRRNSTVTEYSYWKLVNDFGLINIHLCDTCLVIIVFYGMYHKHWSSPFLPTFVFTVATISLYFICDQISYYTNYIQHYTKQFNKNNTYIDQNGEISEIPSKEAKRHYVYDKLTTLKSSLLIVFIVLTLSPVLRSLTNSTSSDSIWALSTWLTIVNIICHNYVYDIQKEDNFFKLSALSTNVIFANVIVLSSRLDSNMAVFCFILISIEIHGLFPIFQFKIRRFFSVNSHSNHKAQSIYITDSYSIISNSDKIEAKKRYDRKKNASFTFGALYFTWVSVFLYYTFHNNIIIIVLWFIINLFIAFFCPGYFIFLQQYKNELQGPWDPAKPTLFNEF